MQSEQATCSHDHLDAANQFKIHRVLHSDSDFPPNVCDVLSTFQVEAPELDQEIRVHATQRESPAPLRPVMALPLRGAKTEMTATQPGSPHGRDVIIITGGLHNIGLSLLHSIRNDYMSMSGSTTVVVIGSPNGSSDFGKSSKSLSRIAGLKIELVKVDITDYNALREVFSRYVGRIRGVVHLAAISRVQHCHEDLLQCRKVNVGGTKNILRALWALHGKRSFQLANYSHMDSALPWLVFASSREVYGDLGPGEVVSENSPLRPVNPYGESKLEAEKEVQQWALKTGFNAVTLRFNNVYGSCEDHGTRLIPRLVSRLISGETIEIFGSANRTISLLHVQDAVKAILLSVSFASRLDNAAGYYETFNIGGGPTHDALSLADIVRITQASVASLVPGCRSCQESPKVISRSDHQSKEPDHFRSSVEKAFQVLGHKTSHTSMMRQLETTSRAATSWILLQLLGLK